MTTRTFKILFLILISVTSLRGQSDQQMTFPNIYFKLNTADYAKMPYTVDSCLKFLVNNIKAKGEPNLAMFRDTVETDLLCKRRIKRFKYDLNKYMAADNLKIFIVPVSWQTVYEQAKKSPPNKMYLSSLGAMLQIVLIDYSPPQGQEIKVRETYQKMN